MLNFRHITVLGTGVLGAQIAFQTAYSGFAVCAYDISAEALEGARQRLAGLAATYLSEVPGATPEQVQAAQARIQLTTDLAEAAAQADLVIEAVPEVPEIKHATYAALAAVAPAHTVFATNSSTLLPSDLKAATGRPERFLALHFANRIWRHNLAEVMGTADTLPEVFDALVAFAQAIGMVPIPIHKEKAGYVLNSVLVPWLNAAAGLAAGGYAHPHDVDKVWQIATGAELGPFQIYDIIGLATPYNILSRGDERSRQIAAWMKAQYIDQGKMGRATGEGFYRYDTNLGDAQR